MWSNNCAPWLYRLERNFKWESRHRIPEDLVFLDKTGKVRLIFERSGVITITRGFAWNGCSPKILMFDLLLGTPEGAVYEPTGCRKTYHASLVHDALYQFLGDGLPITRGDADRIFLELLEESEFIPRRIYWLAVRGLGWLVWRSTRIYRKTKGVREEVASLLDDGLRTSGERDAV